MNSASKKNNVTELVGGFVIGVLLLMILYGWGVYEFGPNTNEARSAFGDVFGVLETFFSGLAFLGLIYTILLQSQELKLQRNELKLQREELQMTRKELERSAQAQTEQVNQQINFTHLQALTAIVQAKNFEFDAAMRVSAKTAEPHKVALTEWSGKLEEFVKSSEEQLDSP